MINVTKTYLPPLEEYIKYLKQILESGWITNNGEVVRELETKLTEYLGVLYIFRIVSNRIITLKIALRALDIKGDAVLCLADR